MIRTDTIHFKITYIFYCEIHLSVLISVDSIGQQPFSKVKNQVRVAANYFPYCGTNVISRLQFLHKNAKDFFGITKWKLFIANNNWPWRKKCFVLNYSKLGIPMLMFAIKGTIFTPTNNSSINGNNNSSFANYPLCCWNSTESFARTI